MSNDIDDLRMCLKEARAAMVAMGLANIELIAERNRLIARITALEQGAERTKAAQFMTPADRDRLTKEHGR